MRKHVKQCTHSRGDCELTCYVVVVAYRINPGAQRENSQKRLKTGPRRIGIKTASVSSPKVIGRALSFAKSGETLDVLLRQ